MKQLTSEERRRIVEIRQTTARARANSHDAAVALETPPLDGRSVRRLLKTISVVALLGGGILAYRLLEFELAGSLVETFLPRL